MQMKQSKEKIRFYDTSALLSGAIKEIHDFTYISSIVLDELEHIKTAASKDENVKYKARKLVRFLMDWEDEFKHEIFPQKAIDKVMRRYRFLENKNDR